MASPGSGGGGEGEAGASTVVVVLVMPALLTVITAVIQFALWYHATNIALTAAREGAREARAAGASAAAGQARAQDFLAQAAGTLLLDPRVSASRKAGEVRVEVAGRATQLLPGLALPVHAASAGPVERWTGPR